MGIIRYVARSVSVLNVLLAGVIAVFLIYALFPLLSSRVSYEEPPERKTKDVAPAKVQALPVPSPADYAVVAENNLFHPERMIPPEKNPEKEVSKPELVLYGTMIADDSSVAYVEDKKAPYTTPGRGARPRVLKKGDTIGGYVLKDIQPNRITLVKNDDTMIVNLDTTKERPVQPGPGQPTSPAGQRQAIAPTAPMQRPIAPQASASRSGTAPATTAAQAPPTAQGTASAPTTRLPGRPFLSPRQVTPAQ
jgi:hypothetical protein